MPTNSPEYWKAYYAKNKLKIAKRKKAYYRRNREIVLAYQHLWNKKNRTKSTARKRAKAVSTSVRKLPGTKSKRRSRDNSSQSGEDRV